MDIVIAVIVTAIISAVLTFVLIKLLDRLRKKDAETEASQIVEAAERDAVNRRKEAEFEVKELTLTQRAETEKELSKLREELRDRESTLR